MYLAVGVAGGGLQRVAASESVAAIAAGQSPDRDITEFLADRHKDYRGEDFYFEHGNPFYYE